MQPLARAKAAVSAVGLAYTDPENNNAMIKNLNTYTP